MTDCGILSTHPTEGLACDSDAIMGFMRVVVGLAVVAYASAFAPGAMTGLRLKSGEASALCGTNRFCPTALS